MIARHRAIEPLGVVTSRSVRPSLPILPKLSFGAQGGGAMKKEMLDRIQKYVHPFRITKGKGFRLKDFDPGDTCGLGLDKGEAAELLARGTEWLAEEQEMLYAQDRWSLLLVFQAMDAAGKDGTIKHVMSGVNPQGCQVFSFKQPSSEDLNHDFLWRYVKCLPERGRIGIFNRSYYEEVLVVRVHPEILEKQRLPPGAWIFCCPTSWKAKRRSIRAN
jgi:polyphosphate kinase 2 (PPK2 family)